MEVGQGKRTVSWPISLAGGGAGEGGGSESPPLSSNFVGHVNPEEAASSREGVSVKLLDAFYVGQSNEGQEE